MRHIIGVISTVPKINEVGIFSITFDCFSGGEMIPMGLFGTIGRQWVNNLKKGTYIGATGRFERGERTGRVCMVVRSIVLEREDSLGQKVNVIT